MTNTAKEPIGRWLTYALGMVIGGAIGIVVLGVLTALYFLGELTKEATFTQWVFVTAFLFFGPAFGVTSASIIFYREGVKGPAMACAGAAFIFATTASYIGWLLGGSRAFSAYLSYPANSPGELVAAAFTLPGFINGVGAVVALMYFLRRPSYGKSFVTLLGAVVVSWVGFQCLRS